MEHQLTALDDARFIYNNCIDIRDAKKRFSNHWWLNQPVIHRQDVWRELINLCEEHGYFKGVV